MQEARNEKTGAGSGSSGCGVRVLMVDDQPAVAETVKRMLAGEENVTVSYCRDPREAVRTALEVKPTVILQDLVMPEMKGHDLSRLFKSHPHLRDIPLVVLSSREEGQTKAEAFANGADDYLVKLPDKVELVARVLYHSRSYINLMQKNEFLDALVQSQKTLAREVERATDYVRSLLPPPVAEGPVQADWILSPCENLGGDSLGYHWIDDTHFAMYLLDVSGHGVGSALLSVSALNAIRGQTLAGADYLDPGSILGALNRAFQMNKHHNLYFTMWYGVYEVPSSTLTWAGAGHPPPLLVEEGGKQRRLETDNGIIGVNEDDEYRMRSIVVSRQATLYVFSDGVFEISGADGRTWEYEDLQEFITAAATVEGCTPGALHRHAVELRGDLALEDDFTVLRLRFAAPTALQPTPH